MSGNGAKRYGGQSGGVTPYYDDWMVNDSVFAVVTGSPSAKGMDNYNQGDVDLTVKNNARIMAGVPAGSLSALQDPASTLATLDALEQHAMGFQQWSAGGSNPRQDIFDNSKFTGLSYGGTNAYWGSTASYTGAFVGKSVTNTGMPFQFDSELTRLLTAPASNSQHVVLKRRVANPSPAVLALLPAS